MALPKELIGKGSRIDIGFTIINISERRNIVSIVHAGNMGNNIESVEENVDLALGKGTFKKLEKSCKKMTEDGWPDYLYKRTMKF